MFQSFVILFYLEFMVKILVLKMLKQIEALKLERILVSLKIHT